MRMGLRQWLVGRRGKGGDLRITHTMHANRTGAREIERRVPLHPFKQQHTPTPELYNTYNTPLERQSNPTPRSLLLPVLITLLPLLPLLSRAPRRCAWHPAARTHDIIARLAVRDAASIGASLALGVCGIEAGFVAGSCGGRVDGLGGGDGGRGFVLCRSGGGGRGSFVVGIFVPAYFFLCVCCGAWFWLAWSSRIIGGKREVKLDKNRIKDIYIPLSKSLLLFSAVSILCLKK